MKDIVNNSDTECKYTNLVEVKVTHPGLCLRHKQIKRDGEN